MFVRRLPAVGFAIALSLSVAAAQEPAETGSIPNWTAPPYWMPPLAREVAAWKEQGLQPEGAEAAEGLPTSALPFFAIQPCRIVDTRPGSGFSGDYGPPAMAANASRDFDLNSAAHCPGIPAGAEAYSINVTVTETTGLGDVRMWPTGSAPAVAVSTQNWPTAGLSLANAAIVPAGTGGAISVYVAGSATHLIIDINGYYAPVGIVNTVNGLFGAVTLAAGSNITITPAGNTLTISAAEGGTGDITAVNAGTGLTGGGVSGEVTLDVAFAGSGSASTASRSDHNHSTAVAPPSGNTVTSLDTSGNVGDSSSVTIGADGLGLISYWDTSANDLNVAHCSNVACTSATITPLDTVGFAGLHSSVAIGADGLGLISYYEYVSGDLRVAHCDNVNCTSATKTPLDTTGDVGQYSSATIGADGLGLISYYDATNDDLKVAHCDNVACTSATITPLDTAGFVGLWGSITTGADGLGLISYHDGDNGSLKVAHCSNVNCTTATITPLEDEAFNTGFETSATIGADGLGLISYHTSADLKVAHCSNVVCTSATITPLDVAGDISGETSVTIGADGLGLISYHDGVTGDLKVAHCSNVSCTAATITSLDTANNVGSSNSVTIGADGLGLISYRDSTAQDLKVLHCSNALCAPFFRRR